MSPTDTQVTPKWGDPGVSELMQIQETDIVYPSANGGNTVRTLQRSGLLKRLRMRLVAQTVFSGTLGTHNKSTYGPLGGAISNLKVVANGQIPLVDISGLGMTVYNEIENRDGSTLARPSFQAGIGLLETAAPITYDAAAIATCNVVFPFEFQFALPVNLNGQTTELGLWLLQNQSIDVGVQVSLNPISSAAVTTDAIWNGSGTVVSTPNLANNYINIERELYTIPNDARSYPNLSWVHQVIEFSNTFTGNFSRFNVPRAGLLLRAVVINLDTANAAIENTDISAMKWIYGSNETPISRPGWALNAEYITDYGRNPPKGVTVLDFYKWGDQGLKLVKDTESLANLRIETSFTATTAGTQRIILDRLIPVLTNK